VGEKGEKRKSGNIYLSARDEHNEIKVKSYPGRLKEGIQSVKDSITTLHAICPPPRFFSLVLTFLVRSARRLINEHNEIKHGNTVTNARDHKLRGVDREHFRAVIR